MQRITGFVTVTGLMIAAVMFSPGAHAQADHALPADIDPESFSRLRALSRDELDAEGKAAYDYVVGDRPKPVTGPVMVTMYSPPLARAFNDINGHLRGPDAVIERKLTEVAILVATWEIEQQYEWSAHEPAALQFGASQETVDTIKYDREPNGLPPEETLIINLGRQLMREHRLDSELFAAAVEMFGERGVVELITVMGDYVMAGLLLTAIDQRQPPSRPALLPPR